MDILYGIISAILFLVVIIAWKYVDKAKKNSLSMELYEHVRWCATKDNYHRQFSLKHYIFKTYSSIISNYQILEKHDIEMLEELLELYQENLVQRFFGENLSTNKDILSLQDDEYFFFTLFCYLNGHNCQTMLGNYTKYELIFRKEYGAYGGTLYDATYSITDFGLVYQKLYYAACKFCENNERTQKLVKYSITQSIADCIDKREIQISRL